MEGPGWDDKWYDKQCAKYRENVLTWLEYPATLPGEFPPLRPDGTSEGAFPGETYPPSTGEVFDYAGHINDKNSMSIPEVGRKVSSPQMKRNTRSREEVFQEIDPRLVEGNQPDDYDFSKPCESCTPNPEDL